MKVNFYILLCFVFVLTACSSSNQSKNRTSDSDSTENHKFYTETDPSVIFRDRFWNELPSPVTKEDLLPSGKWTGYYHDAMGFQGRIAINLPLQDSNGYSGNFTFTERGYYDATQITGTCRLTHHLEKVSLSFFVSYVADTVIFEGIWKKPSKMTSNVMYGILKDPQKKVFFGGTWMLVKD